MKIEPSPFLTGVTAYAPPPPARPIDLKLDGNEGRPPPASLLDVVTGAGPEIARAYPDARPLESEIAESIGTSPDRVIVTAGGDDAIERAIRAVLAPGREMVLPVPTFGMIERYARLAGGSVVTVGWPDGPYPVDGVLDACTDRTSIVVVVSPNSPSGLVATARDIERLSEGAPRALVLVDLAYVEFADEDLTSRVLEIDNAILVRSMSKAWGLAGLRVGWAAGPAGIVDWLRAAGHPYAVSAPSLAIARERLRTGRDDVSGFVSRIREERSRLTSTLRSLGVRVPDSQSNFVLGRFADAEAVRSGLAERGIAVRIFPGKPGLDGCLRITLPGEGEGFERLTRALTEILTGKEVTP